MDEPHAQNVKTVTKKNVYINGYSIIIIIGPLFDVSLVQDNTNNELDLDLLMLQMLL